MPRRKWIPKEYWRRMPTPHASGPPPSLWWYHPEPGPKRADLKPDADSQQIIDEYLRRRARAGALVGLTEKELEDWLSELTRPHKVSPRRKFYWTIPCFAVSKRINAATAMAWFRALEKVAKELFPDRVPYGRKPKQLTPEQIQEIRTEYLDTGKVKTISFKYGIPAFRVGRLCQAEKKAREARNTWDTEEAGTATEETVSVTPDDNEEIF
jgi:hypothetical protein